MDDMVVLESLFLVYGFLLDDYDHILVLVFSNMEPSTCCCYIVGHCISVHHCCSYDHGNDLTGLVIDVPSKQEL